MTKLFRKILEYTWLVIAILSLVAGLHKTYKYGFKESYIFFIMTFIAVLMFTFRRYNRMSDKE